MKSGTRKFLAILIVLVIVVGGIISVTGAGPIPKLKDSIKYGLDINGGVYVLLEADITGNNDLSRDQLLEQTRSVLENRVNAMGISESSVSVEGSDRIRVEMPGVKDAEEAIKQIGRTAQLKFMLADGSLVMTGDGIKNASFTTDGDHGGYKITMDFTSDGATKFEEGTRKASSGKIQSILKDETGNAVANNSIVIMLDNEVISAPTVEQTINSRSCEIFRQGGFSQEEASSVSALIRGGALPASLKEINSSIQTATIGADALDKSIVAGAIGLGLVFVIMILAYGILGVTADIALILYVELILWIMALVGSVLTLPGIAGIILSIGMAVDSNVIIFTRIREEITKGKTIRVAVDHGYKSAISTVIDAQTTTLIAAIVLYLIGTTTVKGFALTLIIGTVCSIFTAVIVTRIFVNLLVGSTKLCSLKTLGMNEDGTPMLRLKKKFRFIENRKKFYAISLCVIIIGMGFAGFRGFNYGIDFTGGTMIQIDLGKEVPIDDIKETISEYNLDPTIVYAGKDNSQIIIRTIKALEADDRTKVVNTIEEAYDIDDAAILAAEEFGPTVGKELKQNAFKSIAIAAVCMLLYIRLRFKAWKYGVAAITGLLHDVLVTLSIYAIFGFTINNPFIAGILTVVGYSINDTIVIFDRIRENTRYYKKKQLISLVDDSVNQTLIRSIMTSLTTIAVMIPLFLMVSTQIREFLIPLIIGVLVGTYSSIFICSPIFYDISRRSHQSKYENSREDRERERKVAEWKDKAGNRNK